MGRRSPKTTGHWDSAPSAQKHTRLGPSKPPWPWTSVSHSWGPTEPKEGHTSEKEGLSIKTIVAAFLTMTKTWKQANVHQEGQLGMKPSFGRRTSGTEVSLQGCVKNVGKCIQRSNEKSNVETRAGES